MSDIVTKGNEFKNKHMLFMVDGFNFFIYMNEDDLYVIKNYSKQNIIKYFNKKKVITMLVDRNIECIKKDEYFKNETKNSKTINTFDLFFKTFIKNTIIGMHKDFLIDTLLETYSIHNSNDINMDMNNYNIKEYKINVIEDYIRFKKSFREDILTLSYIKNKNGDVVLSGKTLDTIKNNVISVWENILGIKVIFKNNEKGKYFKIPLPEFKDINFYIINGLKQGSDKKIQGMSILFWYNYELYSCNKDFFKMMFTRLSREDSKALFILGSDKTGYYLKEESEKYKLF